MNIKETTNYNIFKLSPFNRPVDKRHVSKIKASMLEEYIPTAILVNSDFEIIDGQHRFTAASELGLPIFYTKLSSAHVDQFARLNTNVRPWTSLEFIAFFAKKGNENYKRVELIQKEFNLKPTLVISLGLEAEWSGRHTEVIKKGLLEFSTYNLLAAQNNIYSLIQLKTAHDWAFNSRFINVLMKFEHESEAFNLKEWVSRAMRYRDLVYKCTNQSGWDNMVETVWNYRRRDGNRITIK